jgi:HEAT repeat protein
MADTEDDPALTALITSAKSGFADAVEHAVRDVYAVGLKPSHVQPLIDLLQLGWHTRHEDIIGLLQRAKDDKASNVLLETATRKFSYLDYDENEGLARKCTWALADIGSPLAIDHLRTLATNENELISSYAKKRLSV